MPSPPQRPALIVGVGAGLSAALARLLSKNGYRVALAARNVDKLKALAAETDAEIFSADASDPRAVVDLFAMVTKAIGSPELVIYNASYRTRGPFVDLDPDEVAKSIAVSAYGGFLVGQQAAKAMLPHGRGTIFFTGASASVKGYAQSAPFAMGKFALRGLAQSMARELAPHGIHVAHAVIDGGIRSASRQDPADKPDSLLDPDAIAQSYLHLINQPRTAWTWEIELRPWVEKF
jgi:NAD(P)-dependent dehydrogenase (short-subunit alcohol dehydrogenase family)